MSAGNPPIFFFPESAATGIVAKIPERYALTMLGNVVPGGARLPEPGVILVTETPDEIKAALSLRRAQPALEIIVVVAVPSEPPEVPPDDVYAYVTRDAPEFVLGKILASAFDRLGLRQEQERVRAEMAQLTMELKGLNAIGIRLSAERDLFTLLEMILTKAREITRSDAGSLYLIKRDEAGNRSLRFTLVQNDSMYVPFKEFTLPITSQSLVGHVARTGEVLNIPDAYHLPPGSPFQLDRRFDERAGYRTKSVLVAPLKTPEGVIVGVIELINHKAERTQLFAFPAEIERKALPFPDRFHELVTSLGSQAAVALENSSLYRELRDQAQRLLEVELQARSSIEVARRIQDECLVAVAQALGGPLERLRDAVIRLASRAEPGEPLQGSMADDVRTLARLVEDLRETYRTRPGVLVLRRHPVDLREIVDLTLAVLSESGMTTQHAVTVTGEVTPVAGDRIRLQQVVWHLLDNASRYTPAGGRIDVTLRHEGPDGILEVQDSGVGIGAELLPRIFDPFVQGQEMGDRSRRGWGLGLTIVKRVVEAHGGTVSASSGGPDQGSTFVVRLPASGGR